MSRDKVGIQEVLDKQDAHALNQVAFELPSRLIAKIYLFRTIFRGSGYSFANDPAFMHVSSSQKYWDNVGEKFYTKYAGIDQCHKRWAEQVMRGEPIVGPLGREWVFNTRNKQGEIFIPWTTLTNYPVQGTGADIVALARVIFWKRVRKLGIPALVVSTVHDSITVDCPEEYVQQVVDLFFDVFEDLIPNIRKLWGYDWIVPMTCEVGVGLNEKDLIEYKRSPK